MLSQGKKLMKNRTLKFGAPFILLIVGGSFGLKEFTSLRYKFGTNRKLSPEEEAELNKTEKKKKERVTLEGEFEKIQSLDIDNWENIRGPRPWEEKVTPK